MIKILTGWRLTIRLANCADNSKSTTATGLDSSAYRLSRHKQEHYNTETNLRSDQDQLIAKYVDASGDIEIQRCSPGRTVGLQNKAKLFDNIACSKNKSNKFNWDWRLTVLQQSLKVAHQYSFRQGSTCDNEPASRQDNTLQLQQTICRIVLISWLLR